MSFIGFVLGFDTTKFEAQSKKAEDTLDNLGKSGEKAGQAIDKAFEKSGENIKQYIANQKQLLATLEQEIAKSEQAFAKMSEGRAKTTAGKELQALRQDLIEQKVVLADLESGGKRAADAMSQIGTSGARSLGELRHTAQAAAQALREAGSEGAKSTGTAVDAIAEQKQKVKELRAELKSLQEEQKKEVSPEANKALGERVAQAKTELAEQKRILDQMKAAAKEAEAALANVAVAGDDTGKRVTTGFSKVNVSLQQMANEQKQVVDNLKNEIAKLQAEYDKMSAPSLKKSDMGGELSAMKQALKEEVALLNDYQSKLKEGEASMTQFGQKGAQAVGEIGKSIDTNVKGYENMTDKGKKAFEDVSGQIEKHKAYITDLQKTIAELQLAYTNAATAKEKMTAQTQVSDVSAILNTEKAKVDELEISLQKIVETNQKVIESNDKVGESAQRTYTKAELKQAIAGQKQSVAELEAEVKKLKKAYDEMLAPGTAKAAMGQELAQMVRHLKEAQAELKQLQNTQATEVKKQDSLIGGLIGKLKGWALGLVSVAAAGKIAKEVIMSTQETAHVFETIITEAKTATEYFFKTLASGDWSNFFAGMREAIDAAHEYMDAMEDIERRRNEMGIKESEANLEIGRLRELTFNKTRENFPERMQALKQILDLEKQIYTKKSDITKDELAALVKKTAATNKLSEAQVKSFISEYSSFKEIIELGEEYNEKRKKMAEFVASGAAEYNPQILQQMREEIWAMGEKSMAAGKFVDDLGKMSKKEAKAIADVWKKMNDEATQYYAKTRRYESQYTQGRAQAIESWHKELEDANDATAKLWADVDRLKVEMSQIGAEQAEATLAVGMANAKRQYQEDIKNFEWSEKVKQAAAVKYEQTKLKLQKEYYNELSNFIRDKQIKTQSDPADILGGYAAIRKAEQDIQELYARAAVTRDEGLKQQIIDDINTLRDYIREVKELIKEGTFKVSESTSPVNMAQRLIPMSATAQKQAEDARRQQAADQARALAANELLKQGYYALADSAMMLSDAFAESNKELAELLEGVASLAQSLGELNEAGLFDGTMGTEEAVGSIIGGVTKLVGMVSNQIAENKRVMKDYYDSILEQQQAYNLALNEQLRLQYEMEGNVFIEDYLGQLVSGTNAFNDAQKRYNEGMAAFLSSEAVTGKQNAISGKNVLSGVGAGAAIGAGIGSFIPVIGTAIGAGIGAIVGGIAGLFAKKKKDVVAPLLEVYPDLLDANNKFNVALAKTLVGTEAVTEETSKALENMIEWTEAAEAAEEQMKGVIEELAGSLGNDLKDALVAAFKEGENAAQAFGTAVDKVLEDIISNMLFNLVFQQAFDKLEEEMMASYAMSGDQNWLDDFQRFYAEAPDLINNFNAGMAEARRAASEAGFNVFSGAQPASQMRGQIERSITEDTGTELAGLMRKISDDNRQNRDYNKQSVEGIFLAVNKLGELVFIQESMMRFMDDTYEGVPVLTQATPSTTVPENTQEESKPVSLAELPEIIFELKAIRQIQEIFLEAFTTGLGSVESTIGDAMSQSNANVPEASTPENRRMIEEGIYLRDRRASSVEDVVPEMISMLRNAAGRDRADVDYNRMAVNHLVAIEANTHETVNELKKAVAELTAINGNTRPVYSGIGL